MTGAFHADLGGRLQFLAQPIPLEHEPGLSGRFLQHAVDQGIALSGLDELFRCGPWPSAQRQDPARFGIQP
jgi:hypothetical protein